MTPTSSPSSTPASTPRNSLSRSNSQVFIPSHSNSPGVGPHTSSLNLPRRSSSQTLTSASPPQPQSVDDVIAKHFPDDQTIFNDVLTKFNLTRNNLDAKMLNSALMLDSSLEGIAKAITVARLAKFKRKLGADTTAGAQKWDQKDGHVRKKMSSNYVDTIAYIRTTPLSIESLRALLKICDKDQDFPDPVTVRWQLLKPYTKDLPAPLQKTTGKESIKALAAHLDIDLKSIQFNQVFREIDRLEREARSASKPHEKGEFLFQALTLRHLVTKHGQDLKSEIFDRRDKNGGTFKKNPDFQTLSGLSHNASSPSPALLSFSEECQTTLTFLRNQDQASKDSFKKLMQNCYDYNRKPFFSERVQEAFHDFGKKVSDGAEALGQRIKEFRKSKQAAPPKTEETMEEEDDKTIPPHQEDDDSSSSSSSRSNVSSKNFSPINADLNNLESDNEYDSEEILGDNFGNNDDNSGDEDKIEEAITDTTPRHFLPETEPSLPQRAWRGLKKGWKKHIAQPWREFRNPPAPETALTPIQPPNTHVIERETSSTSSDFETN